VAALKRIKSYLDYGVFQPIQIASIIALNGPEDCVQEIRDTYKERRDALVRGLSRAGWKIPKPKGTMFVWGRIPEKFAAWVRGVFQVSHPRGPGSGFARAWVRRVRR